MSPVMQDLENYDRKRWGPTRVQYLNPADPMMRGILNRPTPSLSTVLESIEGLDKWYLADYSMLQDALAIVHYPKSMYKLEVLRLNFNCMRLLQDYTSKHNLFDHYYGLLCVRVLAFCVQLHMVAFAATAGTHVERMEELDGAESIVSTLEYHSSRSVYEVFNNPALASNPGTLPLPKHESYFLQRIMWDDRKGLFEVSSKIKISGWGLLMASIILQLFSDERKSKKELILWYQTSDLVCRHYLGATEDAFPYASQVSGMIDTYLTVMRGTGSNIPAHKPAPIDLKDFSVFCRALTVRLRDQVDRRLSPRLAASLVQFIFHYAQQLGPDNFNGDFWLSVEAMFDRLWEEIEVGKYLRAVEARKDLLALTYAIYRGLGTLLASTYSAVNPRNLKDTKHDMPPRLLYLATMLTRTFIKVDWFGLCARLLLLPSLPLSGEMPSPGMISRIASNPSRVIGYIEDLVRVFSHFDTKTLEPFHHYYAEWVKVLLFIKNQQVKYPLHRKHFEQCESLWRLVGWSLELTDRVDQRCLYTGCVNTIALHDSSLDVCEGCHVAFYCSRRCQKADWQMNSMNPHQLVCAADLTTPELIGFPAGKKLDDERYAFF